MVIMNESRPAVWASSFPDLNKRTKEEIHAIESVTMPDFTPPYPLLKNPHSAKATANHWVWFDQQSLAAIFTDHPKELQKLRQSKLYKLPQNIFVDAGQEELEWICNYVVWLFACDDFLETLGKSNCPEKADTLFMKINLVLMWSFPDDPLLRDNLEEFFSLYPAEQRQATFEYVDATLAKARLHPGTDYDTGTSGTVLSTLCMAFTDLWGKLVEKAPAESSLRWGRAFQDYLTGIIHEFENRARQTIPSLADYILLRRKASGVITAVVIVEYTDKVNYPEELFNSPEMQTFLDALNDVVSYHNDIWSFKKEVLSGDVHNLVFVFSHEKGCSFSDAAVAASEMLHSRLQDLQQAMVEVDRFTPPEHKPAIAKYIKVAQCWISGQHKLETEVNGRYQ